MDLGLEGFESEPLTNWNMWNPSEKRPSLVARQHILIQGNEASKGSTPPYGNCIRPPPISIETFGISLLFHHTLSHLSFSQASRCPHHKPCKCTMGSLGVRISQHFTSGTPHFSQGQNSGYLSKRCPYPYSGRRSISPFSLPCIHDMARMLIDADGDDQVSSGFLSAAFLLFPVELSVSLAYTRLREPHPSIPYCMANKPF